MTGDLRLRSLVKAAFELADDVCGRQVDDEEACQGAGERGVILWRGQREEIDAVLAVCGIHSQP